MLILSLPFYEIMFVYNFHVYEALVELHKNLAEAKQHKWLYLSLVGSFPPLLPHLLSLTSFRCCSTLLIPRTETSAIFHSYRSSPNRVLTLSWESLVLQWCKFLTQGSRAPLLPESFALAFIISRSASVQREKLGNEKQAQKKLWSVEDTTCCPAGFAGCISTGSSAHSSSNPQVAFRAWPPNLCPCEDWSSFSGSGHFCSGKKKFSWERTYPEWKVILGSVQKVGVDEALWRLSGEPGSAGLTVELDGFRGLLQPKWFYGPLCSQRKHLWSLCPWACDVP